MKMENSTLVSSESKLKKPLDSSPPSDEKEQVVDGQQDDDNASYDEDDTAEETKYAQDGTEGMVDNNDREPSVESLSQVKSTTSQPEYPSKDPSKEFSSGVMKYTLEKTANLADGHPGIGTMGNGLDNTGIASGIAPNIAAVPGANAMLEGAGGPIMGLAALNQAQANSKMHGFIGEPDTSNQAAVDNTYTDYSRIPSDGAPSLSVAPSTASGKEPPFPVKLHRILSNTEYVDIISWLPHGRSWRVLKPKAFEEKVVPLYFRHAKYASFMRQVNGWGFKRITQGPDHNSYYHELFLRGMPHLCLKMRRPARAKTGPADSEVNPDFYSISLVAPLPNPDSSGIRDASQLQGIQDFGLGRAHGLSNLMGLQPAALGLQTPEMQMQMGGLANMNLQNSFGVGGLNNPALSANAFLQQQLQGQIQPRLGSAGQQFGLPTATTNGNQKSLDLAEANSEMSQQIESLRQRKEQLVRQLQMYNQGHDNSSTAPANPSDPPADGETSGQLPDASSMNLPTSLPSTDQNPFSQNIGSNSTQLQQVMLQLQAAGMKGAGVGGNFQPNQNLSIGNTGARLGLNNNTAGGGLGNLNQQLLLQQGLASSIPGITNSLVPSNIGGLNGNLGLAAMQNQMLPQLGNSSLLPNQQQQPFGAQSNNAELSEKNSMQETSSPTDFGEKKSI